MKQLNFRFLWLTILVAVIYIFLQYLGQVFDYRNEVEAFKNNQSVVRASYWFVLIDQLSIFVYFIPVLFMGIESKYKKAGIIAFLTYSCLWILFIMLKINPQWMGFLRYLPACLGIVIFAVLTKLPSKGKIYFILLGSFLFWGVYRFISPVFNKLSDTVFGKLLSDVTNRHYFLQVGGDYRTTSLDYILGTFFSLPLLYISFVWLYNFISGLQSKDDFNQIIIGNCNLPKAKNIMIYFFAHFGTFLFSLGIFFWVLEILILHDRGMTQYLQPLGFHLFFNAFIGIVCLLILLLFQRKFMVETFLNYQKKISWNYFFCNIFLIGFIVWLFNFLAWEKPKTIDRSKLEEIYNEEKTTFKFIFISVVILFNLLAAFNLMNDQFNLFLIGINVVSIGVFVYYRFGLQALVAIKIILFIFLIYSELNTDFLNDKKNFIDPNFFYSITFFFLIYPIFFLGSFKIQLEKEQSIL